MKTAFDEAKAKLFRVKKEIASRTRSPDDIFEFDADFQTINPMLTTGDLLTKQVYEDISATPLVYALINTLNRCIDSLNKTVISRNNLIEFWRQNPSDTHHNLLYLYFGLKNRNGHVDTTFPDTIAGICQLNDDCIYFSHLICMELSEHAQSIRSRLDDDSIPINRPDFTKAKEQGLFPDPVEYKDWDKMFVRESTKNY